MNLTRAVYQRTKNLGNYESEKLELEVAIGENDNGDTAVTWLMAEVTKYLNNVTKITTKPTLVTTPTTTETDTTEPTTETVTEPVKKAVGKKTRKSAVTTADVTAVTMSEAVETTKQMVKDALFKVSKAGMFHKAKDILNQFGADKVDTLNESNYAAVVEEANKLLN